MSLPTTRLSRTDLHRVAEREHRGSAISSATPSADAERLRDGENQERREHDHVAMGEIDEPHHAEDQREARREQRVEPAEQDALQHGVEAGIIGRPQCPK